jgi:hypothetical protein
MGFRRSCCKSQIQWERPSEGQQIVPIIWYFAAPSAKTYTGVNAFSPGIWDRDQFLLPPLLGEQPPYARPYYDGENIWGYTGQCIVGTPEQYAWGLTAADLVATPPPRLACCAAGWVTNGLGVGGGPSVQGLIRGGQAVGASVPTSARRVGGGVAMGSSAAASVLMGGGVTSGATSVAVELPIIGGQTVGAGLPPVALARAGLVAGATIPAPAAAIGGGATLGSTNAPLIAPIGGGAMLGSLPGPEPTIAAGLVVGGAGEHPGSLGGGVLLGSAGGGSPATGGGMVAGSESPEASDTAGGGAVIGAAASDVPAGPALWLIATTVSSGLGNPVSLLPDSSGNGNNATQGSVPLQPVLRSIGGNVYVQFDGTTTLNLTASVAGGSQFTLYAVWRDQTAAPVLGGVLGGNTGATNFAPLFYRVFFPHPFYNWGYENNGTGSGFFPVAGSGFGLYSICRDGTNLFGAIDGFLPTSATATTSAALAPLTAVASDGVPTNFGTGELFELIVYNRVLTALEDAQVATYLAHKYGLPVP